MWSSIQLADPGLRSQMYYYGKRIKFQGIKLSREPLSATFMEARILSLGMRTYLAPVGEGGGALNHSQSSVSSSANTSNKCQMVCPSPLPKLFNLQKLWKFAQGLLVTEGAQCSQWAILNCVCASKLASAKHFIWQASFFSLLVWIVSVW